MYTNNYLIRKLALFISPMIKNIHKKIKALNTKKTPVISVAKKFSFLITKSNFTKTNYSLLLHLQ